MQAVQQGAMMDECELLTRSTDATDPYGYPAEMFTVTATLQCGLSHSQTNDEAMLEFAGGTQAPMEIRQLRLAVDTSSVSDRLSNLDRIRITRRFGTAVTPVTYEIVGDPQRGPSGLLLRLQKVTHE